jgi:BNR repeat-like domain
MALCTRRTFLRSLTVIGVPVTPSVTEAAAEGAAPPPCDLVPGPFVPVPIGTTNYSGLPTITRLPSGSLRLAWFQGADHLSYGTATVMTSLSRDDGQTWSAPRAYSWADSLRDPGLSTIGGRVWLSYFTGTAGNPATGVFVRGSVDGGETFGTPDRVDPNLPYAACSAPLRAVGDVLGMPWYGRRAGDAHDSAWLSTRRAGTSEWTTQLVADGQADGRGYAEPWLLVDHPRLRMFHRYGGRDRIGLTESADGGQSWTRRPLFAGWGKPAAIRLSTGQLVVIYRSITDSSAVYAISRDDGLSWDPGRVLVPNTAGTALGMIYAAPVEISGGRVYVVVSMEDNGTSARLWHGQLTCP